MAYTKPQSMYNQQRGALAGYQYKNMNRYVPTQIRAWAKASGNPYTLAQWKKPPTAAQQNNAYFNNVLMQRIGGDASLRDRMMGNYYSPTQYSEAWKSAPVWQPGLQDWAKARLQGDSGATGQGSYQGGDLTYTGTQGQNSSSPSHEAVLARLGFL